MELGISVGASSARREAEVLFYGRLVDQDGVVARVDDDRERAQLQTKLKNAKGQRSPGIASLVPLFMKGKGPKGTVTSAVIRPRG